MPTAILKVLLKYVRFFGVLAWSIVLCIAAAETEPTPPSIENIDQKFHVIVKYVGHGNCIIVKFPEHRWESQEVPAQTMLIDCGAKEFKKSLLNTAQSEMTPATHKGKSVPKTQRGMRLVPFSLDGFPPYDSANLHQNEESSDGSQEDLTYDFLEDGWVIRTEDTLSREQLIQEINAHMEHQDSPTTLKTVVITHADQDHYSFISPLLSVPTHDNTIENLVLGGSVQKYINSVPEDIWGKFQKIYATELINIDDKTHAFPIHKILPYLREQGGEWENIFSQFDLQLAPAKFGESALLNPGFGKAFDFGGRFKIDVLTINAGHVISSNRGTITKIFQEIDENTNSIILKITDKASGKSILFTGDATGLTTTRLMDALQYSHQEHVLQSDVLIAAHHGSISHGSNNFAWIESVNPKFIIISMGINSAPLSEYVYHNFNHPGIATTKPHRLGAGASQIITEKGIFSTTAHGDIKIVFPQDTSEDIKIHSSHSGTGVFEALSKNVQGSGEQMEIEDSEMASSRIIFDSEEVFIKSGEAEADDYEESSYPERKRSRRET